MSKQDKAKSQSRNHSQKVGEGRSIGRQGDIDKRGSVDETRIARVNKSTPGRKPKAQYEL